MAFPRRKRTPWNGHLTAPLYTQSEFMTTLVAAALSAGYTPADAVKRSAAAMAWLRDRCAENKWDAYGQRLIQQLTEGAIKAAGRDSGTMAAGRAVEAAKQMGKVLREWKGEHMERVTVKEKAAKQ